MHLRSTIWLCALILALSAAVAAQGTPDTQSRVSVSAGIELRTDDADYLDQSPSVALGAHYPLWSFIHASGVLNFTPALSAYDISSARSYGLQLGLRFQVSRGPWSPFIGLYYDLRRYSGEYLSSPYPDIYGMNLQESFSGTKHGLAYRIGVARRISGRFGAELSFHGIQNGNGVGFLHTSTGRPDTQQNQSGTPSVRPDGSIFCPATIGLAITARL
jgi:hypothetical protein